MMTDSVVTPQIKHEVEITIQCGENTSKYILPTVAHESSDAMSSLIAAIVHLESRCMHLEYRVCELETEISAVW